MLESQLDNRKQLDILNIELNVFAFIYCFTLLREYMRHSLYEKIIVLGLGFTGFLPK